MGRECYEAATKECFLCLWSMVFDPWDIHLCTAPSSSPTLFFFPWLADTVPGLHSALCSAAFVWWECCGPIYSRDIFSMAPLTYEDSLLLCHWAAWGNKGINSLSLSLLLSKFPSCSVFSFAAHPTISVSLSLSCPLAPNPWGLKDRLLPHKNITIAPPL